MRHLAYVLISMGFLFPGITFCAETSHKLALPAGKVITLTSPSGLQFGIWGNKVSYPAPTIFIFSSTIEESLNNPYYRQCGNLLAKHGFLCVSLDLPGHGLKQRKGEPAGLAAWRVRSDGGEDFITPFTQQVREALDHLINIGYTDPERIAACGTSRGGFMALHTTAADPRIRATAAFAPVTALATLREFHGTDNQEQIKAFSLHAKASQLAGRSLWLVIGDRDERVGTDDTISFARQVTTYSLSQSKSADVTLIVKPEPKGHTTPAGSPETAAKWILEKLE